MASIVYTDNIGPGPDWTMVQPNKSMFDAVALSAQSAMQNLTQQALTYINNAKEVYRQINYGDAMRAARSMLRKFETASMVDTIMPLTTIGQMQQAKPTMMRYIMASPFVRESYMNKEIEGYGEKYVDSNPGQSGDAVYEYRRVMNGIWHDDNGIMTNYHYNERIADDDDLEFIQQLDIMSTWDNAKHHIMAGMEDPTSPDNNMM